MSLVKHISSRIMIRTKYLFKPSRVTMLGVTVDAGDPVFSQETRRAFYSNKYEKEEASLVKNTLKENDTVVELGAGIGFISTLCCKVIGNSERVTAYEANPRMESVIRRTYALNSVSPCLIMGAIATVRGTVEFHANENFLSGSTYRRIGVAESITVPCFTLKDIIERHSPTYLISDIEGAETEVFRSAPLVGVRAICLEVHPHIVGHDKVNVLIDCLRRERFDVRYDLSASKRIYLEREDTS